MYTTYVTITDPTDPHGMPLFDGPLDDVHTVLVPGDYAGTWEDDIAVDGDTYPATIHVSPIGSDMTVHYPTGSIRS
jgi:hypothetical protein